ncbi:MAG: NUDIX domain-containing protein [Chloroflexi bacterium]|nr:NUDIX domain-containing protein [Chloroflexota bacterium]
MINEQEIENLARRYGEPARATFEFAPRSLNFCDWVRRLTRRRGEIILVVPRGGNQVLLHTKPHYPENVYRLPTGGIRQAEAADDAAQREGFEEIGFTPQTLHLLGVLENVFWFDDEKVIYPSFVFQTEEFARTPQPTDPDEPISGFMDADAIELRVVAHYLSSLPAHWREWGKFRATAHTWLAEHWQD